MSKQMWAKGSIEAPGQRPRVGRPASEIAEMLGVELKSLVGKRVLDLGSSLTAEFARTLLNDHQITACVVSLSPDYSLARHRTMHLHTHLAVAAIGEQLPFADETFDVVLSWKVIEHIATRSMYEQFVQEAIRVLRAGGWLHMGPLWGELWNDDQDGQHYMLGSTFFDRLAPNVKVCEEEINPLKYQRRVCDPLTGMGQGSVPTERIKIKKI